MSEAKDQDGIFVHAGFPNPATDISLGDLDLHRLLIQHGASSYYFRIRGAQWEKRGIFDQDIAIVDKALDPRKTDSVIWWAEGQDGFSITAYKEMPENATVWGVVTAVIHQLRKTDQ